MGSRASSSTLRPHWVRPARQRRTRGAIDRFLDAATQLIEERGWEELTVSRLASRAGTSASAFYRRFRDKEALLHALHERTIDRGRGISARAVAPERWEGAGITEILRATTALAVRIGRSETGLRRALYQRALSDPVFRERERSMLKGLLDESRELLLRHRAEIRHPRPEVAIEVVQRQIVSVLSRRFEASPLEVEGVPLSDEELTEELLRSAAAYLGVAYRCPAPEPEPGALEE